MRDGQGCSRPWKVAGTASRIRPHLPRVLAYGEPDDVRGDTLQHRLAIGTPPVGAGRTGLRVRARCTALEGGDGFPHRGLEAGAGQVSVSACWSPCGKRKAGNYIHDLTGSSLSGFDLAERALAGVRGDRSSVNEE